MRGVVMRRGRGRGQVVMGDMGMGRALRMRAMRGLCRRRRVVVGSVRRRRMVGMAVVSVPVPVSGGIRRRGRGLCVAGIRVVRGRARRGPGMPGVVVMNRGRWLGGHRPAMVAVAALPGCRRNNTRRQHEQDRGKDAHREQALHADSSTRTSRIIPASMW